MIHLRNQKSRAIAAAIVTIGAVPQSALAEDAWALEEVQSHPAATAELTLGSDGDVYGTFIGDPLYPGPVGSLFRIDAAGTFSTLHTFIDTVASRLVVGTDGALYGTTCEGCENYD